MIKTSFSLPSTTLVAWLLPSVLFSGATVAQTLKALPSSASAQAQLDVDSIVSYPGFIVHRSFVTPQKLPSGKEYTRLSGQHFADCAQGRVATASTEYFNDVQTSPINVQVSVRWKNQFATPAPGSDMAAALTQVCERTSAASGTTTSGATASRPTPPDSSPPASKGPVTGSGVVIDRSGVILTNEHVVRQCARTQIISEGHPPRNARVLASDATKDLALIQMETTDTPDKTLTAVAQWRSDSSPRLGEPVAVVGFPLVNVLSTQPNVGFGHVNSIVGARGNPVQMQIDVPIQRGNSGGPVLDARGHVIGVVASKLDALKLAKRTGELPQNINFAIRGDVVRSFLDAHTFRAPTTSEAFSSAPSLDSMELSRRGVAITVRVLCQRGNSAEPPSAASSAFPPSSSP